MKLSTILIGALLVAGTAAFAQTGTKNSPVKSDSTKVVKKDGKEIKPKTKPKKTKKEKPQKISANYCPPCGMG